jgi:hypothetical protein
MTLTRSFSGGGHHQGDGQDDFDDDDWEDDENTRRGIGSPVLPRVMTMLEVREPASDMTLEHLLSGS